MIVKQGRNRKHIPIRETHMNARIAKLDITLPLLHALLVNNYYLRRLSDPNIFFLLSESYLHPTN